MTDRSVYVSIVQQEPEKSEMLSSGCHQNEYSRLREPLKVIVDMHKNIPSGCKNRVSGTAHRSIQVFVIQFIQ